MFLCLELSATANIYQESVKTRGWSNKGKRKIFRDRVVKSMSSRMMDISFKTHSKNATFSA